MKRLYLKYHKKTNQSLRIRKFLIPTAHHLPEVCPSSTTHVLCTIYANYFHRKLLIKYIVRTHSLLVSQAVSFPSLATIQRDLPVDGDWHRFT